MKTEIVSRESIKPSSPTPPHLRSFKLSLLDQVMPLTYSAFVFFFPAISNTARIQTTRRSDQLKKSLSETLTRYYPFAGRLDDGFSNVINCNDEGADYIEAHVDCELSKILGKPEIEVLAHFLPWDVVVTEPDQYHRIAQLGIQVNNFNCGGLAIGTCFLHKIIDGSSLMAFIKDWASIASCSSQAISVSDPIFLQDSFFPSRDLSELFPNDVNVESSKADQLIMNTPRKGRFVFTGTSIAALKAKVMSNNSSFSSTVLKHPTRTEVVSSLICQRIMAAFRGAKPGPKRLPFVARHMLDMRGRLVPPLPRNSIGNMIWEAVVSLRNESESELVELVLQLRDANREIDGEYLKDFQGDEGTKRFLEDMEESVQIYSEEKVDSCAFISVCKLPFYEADFGWGKPVWVAYCINDAAEATATSNKVILMDTREGDGIEAWLTLDEQIMALLECDKDLLAFALPNPSVDATSFTRSSL